jgi:hypothetical protein
VTFGDGRSERAQAPAVSDPVTVELGQTASAFLSVFGTNLGLGSARG